jgi:hypothetical protein
MTQKQIDTLPVGAFLWVPRKQTLYYMVVARKPRLLLMPHNLLFKKSFGHRPMMATSRSYDYMSFKYLKMFRIA